MYLLFSLQVSLGLGKEKSGWFVFCLNYRNKGGRGFTHSPGNLGKGSPLPFLSRKEEGGLVTFQDFRGSSYQEI